MEVKLEPRTDFGRIGVLMGGLSTERDISLKSGRAVCKALSKLNMDVVAIDITSEDTNENIELIKSRKIECAFVAMHGRFGEDGQIQGILDSLNIPYTASGKRASELAMDKIASRRIFEANGLTVPRYCIMGSELFFEKRKKMEKIILTPLPNLPLVVKPATHGSSIGLSIVDKEEGLLKALELAFSFDERVIVEEYIKGREMTVGILDEKALALIEIVPKNRFFDYEAKYKAGMAEYILPAQINDDLAKKIQEAALSAHKLLGCFGCSRVDIILSEDNTPFILELNSIPGLTEISLLPKAARLAGIEFSQLCLKLIVLAYEKK